MKHTKRKNKKLKSTDNQSLRKELSASYGKKEEKRYKRILRKIRLEKPVYWWKERRLWQKFALIILAILLFVVTVNYCVARWYIAKHNGEPLHYGVTYIPGYARYLGLNDKDTLKATLGELGVKRLRLVSYWKDIERNRGEYDFSELDWQFKMANDYDTRVSLAIGMRQPRWPECHEPEWAKNIPKDEWYPELKKFIKATMERYKDNPALESWQLENEFFLEVFGECKDFDKDRLIDEYNFAKSIDPSHPVIISRSNNWVGIPLGEPRPDMVGIAVYKRVWDKTVTKRYFEYPLPAWFYAMLAGWTELLTGRNMMIHELQAEPWAPDGFDFKTMPISEQDKSMNDERLKDRFEYARATGMKRIDLWGVEWWYRRKVLFNDPSLWNAAKESLTKYQDSGVYK